MLEEKKDLNPIGIHIYAGLLIFKKKLKCKILFKNSQ